MSGQEKRTVSVVGKTSGDIVTSGKRHSSRRILHLKLIGMVVFCVLIVGVAVGVAFKIANDKHKALSTQSAPKLPTDFASFTPTEKAQFYILGNDYSAAQNVYETKLKTAKTSAEKVQLYGLLAGIALDKKDYNQAVTYQKKAYALDANYVNAKAVGYAAQLAGDKKTATQYYKLAISRVDKNLPNYQRIVSQIQTDLSEVNGNG